MGKNHDQFDHQNLRDHFQKLNSVSIVYLLFLLKPFLYEGFSLEKHRFTEEKNHHGHLLHHQIKLQKAETIVARNQPIQDAM